MNQNTPQRMTSAEAAARGRIGAYAQQSRNDTREMTASARAAFDERFLREVDPNLELEPAERRRRARAARKAFYARLALASARARAKRRRESGS
jgi:hypothetical protein